MCEISSHTSITLQRSSTPGRFVLLHRLVVESRIFGKTIHDSADPGKPGMRINFKIGKSCLFRHQFWQYSGKMASTQFEIIEVNYESSPQGLVN